MDRLTYDDDLFLRMECVLGVPVVNQIVWRFTEFVPLEELEAMRSRLAEGPIHRTVRRSRVPGARDVWVPGSVPADPLKFGAPIARDGIDEWIERQALVRLDPIQGPAWRLSATPVQDGGMVVSLVGSHVVGDGGALTSAAAAAATGRSGPDDFVGPAPTSSSRWPAVADMADSAGRVAAAATGLARAAGRSASGAVRRTTRSGAGASAGANAGTVAEVRDRPHLMLAPAEGQWIPSTVVVDCPAPEWSRAAANNGGSSNSLLVAVVLGVLVGSGRIGADDGVRVALPVSTRKSGDRRANATSGVSIHLDGANHHDDLTAIRVRSKEAFRAQGDPNSVSTFDLTKPVMQLLPDAVVAKLAASGTAPLCLCSNLGSRGAALRTIGGVDAAAVAMRSITQNTGLDLLRRTKGGVSAWWNESGEVATLCITGLDPDRFPSKTALRALVEAEFRRWQLTPRFW